MQSDSSIARDIRSMASGHRMSKREVIASDFVRRANLDELVEVSKNKKNEELFMGFQAGEFLIGTEAKAQVIYGTNDINDISKSRELINYDPASVDGSSS